MDSVNNPTLSLVTGGVDGYVRLWDLSKLLSENPEKSEHLTAIDFEHTLEFNTQKELDGLDVSKCGTVLATINSKETALWDLKAGKQLLILQEIPELAKNFKAIF